MARIFPVRDRVVLHLQRFASLRDHYLVSNAITQAGIAKSLGIQRSHTARALAELSVAGYIEECKGRTEETGRRVKTYFLSPDGLQKAKNLSSVAPSGLRFARTPSISNFVGRSGEMATLEQWMAGPSHMMLVTGKPGSGRTALVARFCESRKDTALCWITLRAGATLESVAMPLAEFLSARGKNTLSLMMRAGRLGGDAPILGRILARDLSGALIVIDDADRMAGWRAFADALFTGRPRAHEVRFILVSTDFPSGCGIEELHVGELGVDDARRLLKRKGVRASDELVAIVSHSPIVINAIRAGRRAPLDSSKGFGESFLACLSSDEVSALELIAVHSGPAEGAFLFADRRVDFQIVSNLIRRGVVHEVGDGEYDIHPIIRECVLNAAPRGRVRPLHLALARHLLASSDLARWLEGNAHLALGGRSKTAARNILSQGGRFIRLGMGGGVEKAAAALEMGAIDARNRAAMCLILSDVFRIRGEWCRALENCDSGLAIYSGIGDQDGAGEALAKRGGVHLEKGDSVKAREDFGLALGKLGAKWGNARARVFDGLATLNLRNGDLGAAEGFLARAEEEARVGEDVRLRILATRGTLEMLRGRFAPARDMYETALDGLRGDLAMETVLLNNIGLTHYNEGRSADALGYWGRAAETALRFGDVQVVYSYVNMAVISYKLGRTGDAERYCAKATDIGDVLRIDMISGSARSVRSHILKDRGDLGGAGRGYREVLGIRRRLGDPNGISSTLNDMAPMALAAGNWQEFDGILSELEAMAGRLSREEMLRVLFNRARGAMLRADGGFASSCLKEASSDASQLGKADLMAECRALLGYLSHLKGDWFIAEKYLQEAFDMYRVLGYRTRMVGILNGLHAVTGGAGLPQAKEYRSRRDGMLSELGLERASPAWDDMLLAGSSIYRDHAPPSPRTVQKKGSGK